MVAHDNQLCLGQAADLLQSCSREYYTARTEACFNSTIGGHIRHILDHYHCFFQGLASGMIDYDDRQRETTTEDNPDTGGQIIRQYRTALAALDEPLDRVVQVKMATGGDHDQVWSTSTVGRELQFLVSHSVHHYALIATICAIIGVPVPADFGIAPSTLRYRTELGK